MRLFVGIPLAAAVTGELAAAARRLQSGADGLRWAKPESWHITLQFLGNAGHEPYECTLAELRALRSPAVPVVLEKLGVFDRAGILIACVRLTPELLLLQERVAAATRLCGFVPEARPYQPHITLARGNSKGRRPGLDALKTKILRQPAFTRFVAREFLLYESFLSPSGSRYEIRERFPLDGG
jgi:2'-5' RNA ligase